MDEDRNTFAAMNEDGAVYAIMGRDAGQADISEFYGEAALHHAEVRLMTKDEAVAAYQAYLDAGEG